jgi:hypothetical protein
MKPASPLSSLLSKVTHVFVAWNSCVGLIGFYCGKCFSCIRCCREQHQRVNQPAYRRRLTKSFMETFRIRRPARPRNYDNAAAALHDAEAHHPSVVELQRANAAIRAASSTPNRNGGNAGAGAASSPRGSPSCSPNVTPNTSPLGVVSPSAALLPVSSPSSDHSASSPLQIVVAVPVTPSNQTESPATPSPPTMIGATVRGIVDAADMVDAAPTPPSSAPNTFPVIPPSPSSQPHLDSAPRPPPIDSNINSAPSTPQRSALGTPTTPSTPDEATRWGAIGAVHNNGGYALVAHFAPASPSLLQRAGIHPSPIPDRRRVGDAHLRAAMNARIPSSPATPDRLLPAAMSEVPVAIAAPLPTSPLYLGHAGWCKNGLHCKRLPDNGHLFDYDHPVSICPVRPCPNEAVNSAHHLQAGHPKDGECKVFEGNAIIVQQWYYRQLGMNNSVPLQRPSLPTAPVPLSSSGPPLVIPPPPSSLPLAPMGGGGGMGIPRSSVNSEDSPTRRRLSFGDASSMGAPIHLFVGSQPAPAAPIAIAIAAPISIAGPPVVTAAYGRPSPVLPHFMAAVSSPLPTSTPPPSPSVPSPSVMTVSTPVTPSRPLLANKEPESPMSPAGVVMETVPFQF